MERSCYRDLLLLLRVDGASAWCPKMVVSHASLDTCTLNLKVELSPVLPPLEQPPPERRVLPVAWRLDRYYCWLLVVAVDVVETYYGRFHP